MLENSMTFYITGSHGYIGGAVAQELEKKGCIVVGLARDPRKWPTFSGEYGIINLAGKNIFTRFSKKTKTEIYESRISTTKALIEAVRRAPQKPKVIISASAAGYYRDRGKILLSEHDAPGTDFLARTCQDWEKPISEFCRSQNIRCVTMRTGIVIGHGGFMAALLPLFKFGLGGKLSSGKQYMPWISYTDIVRLYIYAAETQSLSGPVNAVAPQLITNSQFTEQLAHTLHRPALFTVSAFALRLFYGELGTLMLYSQKVSDKKLLENGFTFAHPTLESCFKAML